MRRRTIHFRSRLCRPVVIGRLIAGAVLAGLACDVAPAGMAVSPLKQEVVVKPGETGRFFVSVSNRVHEGRGAPLTARLEVTDFVVSEQGDILFAPAGTVPNSASSWITLGKSEVTVPPGAGEEIPCTVKAPYAAAGEYYSAVMVTLAKPRDAEKGLAVTYRIASGVFVTVPGRTFPRQAAIARAEVVWAEAPTSRPAAGLPATGPAKATEAPPATVVAVVKNIGRRRFDASGTVTVVGPGHRVLLKAPLTSRRPLLIGGDARRFECALNRALPAGDYLVQVVVDYESGWAKAHRSFPLTISADQAEALARAAEGGAGHGRAASGRGAVRIAPDRLAADIPAGGLRALSLSFRNAGDGPVRCTATLAAENGPALPASWVEMRERAFPLGKGESRSVPLLVRVPGEAEGAYKAMVVVATTDESGATVRSEIPIEVRVKKARDE